MLSAYFSEMPAAIDVISGEYDRTGAIFKASNVDSRAAVPRPDHEEAPARRTPQSNLMSPKYTAASERAG